MAFGQPGRQRPQVGGKDDVGRLLLQIKVRLRQLQREGHGSRVLRPEEVTVGDGELPHAVCFPPHGALWCILRRGHPAGGAVQQLNIALLGAGRREGQPRLHLLARNRHQRPDIRLQGNAGGEGAFPLHPGQHGIPLRVVHRLVDKPRCLLRVDAQGLQELPVYPQLPVHHPPVDAPAVQQGVELRLGKAGPLRPYQGHRLGAGVGVVVGQAGQPQPLRLQPGGQQGLDAGGEPGVDQLERPRQIPHIPAAGDVGGQGVVQVEKGLILVVHKYPPLRFLSPA